MGRKMKKRFDFFMVVLTVLFASFGIGFVGGVHGMMDSDSVGTSLVCAILFFTVPVLTGYLAIRIALLLRRRKMMKKNSDGSLKTLVIALLLSAVVGAVGQLVYAIEWQTYTTEKVIETKMKGSHVVMLMDISGSMLDEKPACMEAACQLIEGLDESTSMQFVAFAAAVKDENVSAFVPLTADNKISLQTLIQKADMSGGTNFNHPLEIAIKTLEKNQKQDYRNMIIMLTDGTSSIDDSVKKTLTGSDIELFTIRITDGTNDSDTDVQALIQLAAKDFPIKPQSDGSIDVSLILESFRAALNSSRVVTEEHRKLALGSDLVFAANMQDFWWRSIVQVVVFGIFSVLVSFAYYGSFGKVSFVLSLATGILCGVVLVVEAELFAMLLIFMCFGAYTVYEIEETQTNV